MTFNSYRRLRVFAVVTMATWVLLAPVVALGKEADVKSAFVRTQRLNQLKESEYSIATIEAELRRSGRAARGFPEPPLGELLPDGTNIRLARDFTYIDLRGIRWVVPKGYSTNGASVPWYFWSFGLAPFSGQYRNGSIVHDYLCDKKRTSDSLQTHLLFYEAMRVGGVSPEKAQPMFEAVVLFGPSWSRKVHNLCRGSCDIPHLVCKKTESAPRYSAAVYNILSELSAGKIDGPEASKRLQGVAVTYDYSEATNDGSCLDSSRESLLP